MHNIHQNNVGFPQSGRDWDDRPSSKSSSSYPISSSSGSNTATIRSATEAVNSFLVKKEKCKNLPSSRRGAVSCPTIEAAEKKTKSGCGDPSHKKDRSSKSFGVPVFSEAMCSMVSEARGRGYAHRMDHCPLCHRTGGIIIHVCGK